jgi:hypothetical protein
MWVEGFFTSERRYKGYVHVMQSSARCVVDGCACGAHPNLRLECEAVAACVSVLQRFESELEKGLCNTHLSPAIHAPPNKYVSVAMDLQHMDLNPNLLAQVIERDPKVKTSKSTLGHLVSSNVQNERESDRKSPGWRRRGTRQTSAVEIRSIMLLILFSE